MSKTKNNRLLLGSGLLLALTSSLCCIVPVLAIVGGTGGAVSAFSWAAPLRPYLLAATVLTLGVAFYQAYKPQRKDECGCEEKKSFMQSKAVLWTIAAISFLLSAFPYYNTFFQPESPEQTVAAGNQSFSRQATLHIRGMSCEACERHVNHALLQTPGVQAAQTFYAKGITIVKFDSTQTSIQQLAARVEAETGYKVIQ
jgi:copper chaperone CopZ